MKEMNDKKKVMILALIDLFLILLFSFINLTLFFYILLINIIFFFIVVPYLLYAQKLYKQELKPEEYYLATVETNYMHMNENILIKMFEIRINNLRQFLFSYLVLIATFTLAVASNDRLYNFFNTTLIIGVSAAKITIVLGEIGVLSIVYQTFGVDRLTLKELEFLLKAKKKLKQLQQKDDTSSTKVIENK